MNLLKRIGLPLALAGSLNSQSRAQHVPAEIVSPAEMSEGKIPDVPGSPGAGMDFQLKPEAILKSKLPFLIFASTEVKSRYMTEGGFLLSEGPVSQTYLGVSIPTVLIKGDSFTPSIWANLDLKRKGSMSEFDVAANYSFPISDKFLGGKLGGHLELGLYDYPDEFIAPNHDIGLSGKLRYSSDLVNVDLKVQQMLTADRGREFILGVSKPFELFNNNRTTITLTPKVSTAYHDQFFGLNGISNIQYGATLGISKGPVNLEAQIKQQQAISDKFSSETVVGIGISIGF